MKIAAIKAYDTNTQNRSNTHHFKGEFVNNQNIISIMKRSSVDELNVFSTILEKISTVKDNTFYYVQKRFFYNEVKGYTSNTSYLCKQVGDTKDAPKTFIPLYGDNITIREISNKLKELYPNLFIKESNTELVKSISAKLVKINNIEPDSFSS